MSDTYLIVSNGKAVCQYYEYERDVIVVDIHNDTCNAKTIEIVDVSTEILRWIHDSIVNRYGPSNIKIGISIHEMLLAIKVNNIVEHELAERLLIGDTL